MTKFLKLQQQQPERKIAEEQNSRVSSRLRRAEAEDRDIWAAVRRNDAARQHAAADADAAAVGAKALDVRQEAAISAAAKALFSGESLAGTAAAPILHGDGAVSQAAQRQCMLQVGHVVLLMQCT